MGRDLLLLQSSGTDLLLLQSSTFCDCAFPLVKPKQLLCSPPPPVRQLWWFQLFCVHDVSPETAMPVTRLVKAMQPPQPARRSLRPATRRVKATQPLQPGRRSLRLFCVRGVLPVKAMYRGFRLGRAIELAQERCWQDRLQK
jgi:hypothetical protein